MAGVVLPHSERQLSPAHPGPRTAVTSNPAVVLRLQQYENAECFKFSVTYFSDLSWQYFWNTKAARIVIRMGCAK